jgi:hypothetical protein
MIPVAPVVGVALMGYAVWRAFRRRKRLTGPEAGWRNPNSIAMEETGEWDVDTMLSENKSGPPFRNPGDGNL